MAGTTEKQKAIKAVKELPPKATLEDAMERLYFLCKIEKGVNQADSGQTISHDQAKKTDEEMAQIRWTIQALDDIEAIAYVPGLGLCKRNINKRTRH